MNSISLENFVSSGCFHLAAASLFGHWLLSWQDRRVLVALPKVLLSGIASATCLRSAAYAVESWQRSAWVVCGSLALFLLVQSLRQWTWATPAQLHREENQAKAHKLKLKQLTGNSSNAPALSWIRTHLLGFTSSLLAIGCVLFNKYPELSSLATPARYVAGVEVIGTSLMLGLALFLCLEMTLISTPSDSSATGQTAGVCWPTVSTITLLISSLPVLCCLAQFVQQTSAAELDANDRMLHVAARVFGLMLLLATFVVWMVPRRLAMYQRGNHAPRDWVSLTLAAWLGMLAFLVVATLPASWPWRVLIKS